MSWLCFLAIFQLAHAYSHETGARAPVVSAACSNPVIDMGDFYRWPTVNPGMAAPVNVVYNYPVYRQPLRSEFTGKSIKISIPADYGQSAGFHLGTGGAPKGNDEKYRLTSIDIRKPAKAYAGLGQALTHVMEMVLVHKQSNGNGWANIILPFQVSTSGADIDIVDPIIAGVELPDRIGQTGYVVAGGTNELLLGPAFEGESRFSEFWGDAPVSGCPSADKLHARFFMRTNVLTIGVDTFQQLMNALENTPEEQPTMPPGVSWLLGTCANNSATCTLVTPVNVQQKMTELQNFQGKAVSEQRSRKADMDGKLKQLKEHQGQPTTNESIQLFNSAVSAYRDLESAASELVSVKAQLAEMTTFATQAASSHWDMNKPSGAAAVSAISVSSEGTTEQSKIGTDQQPASLVQERSDCRALGLSPVDIDSKRVFDPTAALSSTLIEPLSFRYMSRSDKGGHLQLSHRGHHLRVAVPSGSSEWPLGGVLSSGVLRGVSYIDIHVPGEHSVDGRIPAAELQLVHESVGDKPAMAVAVPLQLREDANPWLTTLLANLPQKQAAQDIIGPPLGLLHDSLLQGSTSSYYRYDGSLTKPPCQSTEWFVLEESGHLSQQQLMQLGAALGIDVNPEKLWQQRGPTFMTSLVMKGSPRLVNQVQGSGLENLVARRFRGRRRLQV